MILIKKSLGSLFRFTSSKSWEDLETIFQVYKMQVMIHEDLSVRRAKQKANLMYKCINNLAPAYLCNLFFPSTPNYDFRNAKKKLLLPKPRTDYLMRSFSYSGAFLWNNLPEDIRTSNSLGFFKRSSHKWFSDQYSHTANM